MIFRTKKYLESAIKDKQKEIEELKKHTTGKMQLSIEKIQAEKANAELKCENEELRDALRRVNQLITSNQYNNSEVLKRKIIELTRDYQSIS